MGGHGQTRVAAGRRRTALVAALATLVVLGGCGNREGILAPAGPVAEDHLELFWIAFWTALGVLAVTGGLLFYGLLHRRRDADEGFPATRFVVLGGIAFPSVVLLAMMGVTFSFLAASPDEAELEVTVTGYQYWWEAYYHDNGAITANEIHIPVGVPVRFHLTTDDVLHSFWVPELGGKQDLVPGRVNTLIVQADEPGTYRGQCLEYCGLQHANMGFLVIAEPARQFQAWLELQAGPAAVQDPRGEALFEEHSCAGCHTIRGTTADGDLGPDLTHVAARTTLGAGTIPNSRGHMMGWVANSQTIKPGNEMPPITTLAPDELQILVDYLRRLE